MGGMLGTLLAQDYESPAKVAALLFILIRWPAALVGCLLAISRLIANGWRFSLSRLLIAITLISLALGLTIYALRK